MKEIFGLEFTRQKWRGGARTITLNKQFIDFFKIYSEQKYSDYIETHHITDGKLLYALRQVYNYRIWEVVDSMLEDDETRKEKRVFIEIMRNYLHRVPTSDKKNDSRIDTIQKGSKHLSEVEFQQLVKVREANKLGKLVHYLFTVLIKLEQKISGILYHEKQKNEETANIPKSQIDRNMTPGETVAEAKATAAAQKIPEDNIVSPSFYIEVKDTWNNMIQEQSIPMVKELTPGRIQSIDGIVKLYGKANLLQAILNVKNLPHNPKWPTKIQFDRFIQVDTFVTALERVSSSVNQSKNPGSKILPEDIKSSWLDEFIDDIQNGTADTQSNSKEI